MPSLTETPRRSPLPAAIGAAVLLATMVGATLAVRPQQGREPATTPPPTTGQPGEVCGHLGLVAVDVDGRQLTCTTTATDDQPRWRTGQLDLPVR